MGQPAASGQGDAVIAHAGYAYTFPNTTRDNPGWLSPSQITEFLRCAYCYKLNRIDHMARPLGINLPIGSAVHKAVEQARLSNNLSINHQFVESMDVSIAAAADWFDQEIAQPIDPETGE